MAIAARAAGTWAVLTASTAITIPAGATSGDRMYLLASWKDFSITASVAGWTEIVEYADGSIATGNGVGSMKVGCWYKDHSGTESNPTLTFSTTTGLLAAAVIVVFAKDGSESWETPTFVTEPITNWTTSVQNVVATNVLSHKSGDLVIGLAGIRDDSTVFTRPTYGISSSNASGGDATLWLADTVEYPAAHLSTTTGNDMAVDAAYRMSGGLSPGGGPGTSLRLSQSATLSAAETGAALWVLQGVTTGGGGGGATEGNPHFIGGGYYG
jgi:hypothetical protein